VKGSLAAHLDKALLSRPDQGVPQLDDTATRKMLCSAESRHRVKSGHSSTVRPMSALRQLRTFHNQFLRGSLGRNLSASLYRVIDPSIHTRIGQWLNALQLPIGYQLVDLLRIARRLRGGSMGCQGI